jgi:hypothetical protein
MAPDEYGRLLAVMAAAQTFSVIAGIGLIAWLVAAMWQSNVWVRKQYLITWEFPRLCRGGSRSLTYTAVVQ